MIVAVKVANGFESKELGTPALVFTGPTLYPERTAFPVIGPIALRNCVVWHRAEQGVFRFRPFVIYSICSHTPQCNYPRAPARPLVLSYACN